MILNFYKNNKWLSIAILLGAIIRILFLILVQKFILIDRIFLLMETHGPGKTVLKI